MPAYRESIQYRRATTGAQGITPGVDTDYSEWTNTYKVTTRTPVFHYPLDIQSVSNHALLQFACVEPPAVELGSFLSNTYNFLSDLAGRVQQVSDNANLFEEGILRRIIAGESIQDIIEELNIELPEVTENDIQVSQGDEAIIGEVVMYLPPNIIVPDNFDYGQAALGITGAAAETSLQTAGGSAVGAAIQGLTSGAQSIISGILGNGSQNSNNNASVAGAVAATTLFGSQGISGAIKGATRVTVNPNTRTLFNNVNIREFSFDFQFIPTSQSEAIEIAAIVEFFRTEAYPELLSFQTGNGLNIPYGYKFPNAWDINAIFKGRKIKGIDFQRSYLRNVTSSYNPTQIGMYEDGQFNEIRMTLTFVEARPLDKAAIKRHYGREDNWVVEESETFELQSLDDGVQV